MAYKVHNSEKSKNRKVFNRLREVRKRDLEIPSQEKLAEILGGEEAGWYKQRVYRYETGEASLTDAVAMEIAAKLNIPVENLFIEPKISFSNYDREFLARYYALPVEKRKQVDDIVFTPIAPGIKGSEKAE